MIQSALQSGLIVKPNKYYNDFFVKKKKKKKRINVLIFDLKALSSQRVHKLTGMEFHILGAACEKALKP